MSNQIPATSSGMSTDVALNTSSSRLAKTAQKVKKFPPPLPFTTPSIHSSSSSSFSSSSTSSSSSSSSSSSKSRLQISTHFSPLPSPFSSPSSSPLSSLCPTPTASMFHSPLSPLSPTTTSYPVISNHSKGTLITMHSTPPPTPSSTSSRDFLIQPSSAPALGSASAPSTPSSLTLSATISTPSSTSPPSSPSPTSSFQTNRSASHSMPAHVALVSPLSAPPTPSSLTLSATISTPSSALPPSTPPPFPVFQHSRSASYSTPPYTDNFTLSRMSTTYARVDQLDRRLETALGEIDRLRKERDTDQRNITVLKTQLDCFRDRHADEIAMLQKKNRELEEEIRMTNEAMNELNKQVLKLSQSSASGAGLGKGAPAS